MEKAADNLTRETTLPNNLRYERKFLFQNIDLETVIQKVHQNSFGFREVFHKRKINNIYFDNANYSFYKQNVEGVANRKKLRLRWYGYETSQIRNPTIEIKKRIGEVGDKDSFHLEGLSLDLSQETTATIHQHLINNTSNYLGLNNELKTLHSTLTNTYERRYYLSFCGRYRITVDFNQSFYNPNYKKLNRSKLTLNDIVLELKYALGDDQDARELSQQIGTRLSKNSKYVNGINILYHPTLL